jgi:hypothetical protein
MRAEGFKRDNDELVRQMEKMKERKETTTVSKSASFMHTEGLKRDNDELVRQMEKMKERKESTTVSKSASFMRAEGLKRDNDELQRKLKDAQDLSIRRGEMKSHISSIKKKLKLKFTDANNLDMVIVMDCTASMSAWMKAAKEEIIKIITSLKSSYPLANIRVGFVGYRDHCDRDQPAGRSRLEIEDLTGSIESVVKKISEQEAVGGGDNPEDIPGGIEAAINMSWGQSSAKIIILVGDAPCHGKDYHEPSEADDNISRKYMDSDPCIKSQMRYLASNGFDFTFIEVKPHLTKKMTDILQHEFNAAPPSPDGMSRTFTRVSLVDATDTKIFAPTVIASASKSIILSVSRSVMAASAELRPVAGKKFLSKKGGVSTYHHYGPTGRISTFLECIKEEESAIKIPEKPVLVLDKLDWKQIEEQPEREAIRHSLHLKPGEIIDWAFPDLKHTTQKSRVKISPNCFAKGAMRAAFGMIDLTMEKHLVGKYYYHKSEVDEGVYFRDVETQIVSKGLAMEFSSFPNLPKAIDFIFTCYYELVSPLPGDQSRYFGAEPYIPGEYKKYNSNDGFVDKTSDLQCVAQAFSHFTWEFTVGKIMVVDLQGDK